MPLVGGNMMEDLGNVWQTVIILVGVMGTLMTFKKYLSEIANDFKKPFNELRDEMKGEIAIVKAELKATNEKIDKANENNIAQNQSIQSGLRFALIRAYEVCKAKGFASLSERDSFEAMYKNYESLPGCTNGVMDEIHDEFMKLPKEKPVTKTRKPKATAEI